MKTCASTLRAKTSTHLIVVFPVALVDVRDDVARGAVLKVTLVCVLVRRVRGPRPVTPHFTVRTANWSVGYCSTIIIHTIILLRKLLDSLGDSNSLIFK